MKNSMPKWMHNLWTDRRICSSSPLRNRRSTLYTCALASCLVIGLARSPVYAQTHTSGGASGGQKVPSLVQMLGGNPVAPAAVPVLPVQPDEVVSQTIEVPVFVVRAKYAYSAPKVLVHPSVLPVRLPEWPDMYGNLAEYYLPIGKASFYILAQRGMTATAEVGQDGSYNVTLKGTKMEVDVSSAGACDMCAVDAAGSFFPEARSYVKSIEGAWRGVSMEKLPVTQLRWNAKTDLFAYEERGNRTLAGFAYYAPASKQSSSAFISEVITGNSRQVNALSPWLFHATLKQIPDSGVDSPPSGLLLYHGSSKMVQQIRAAHLHLNAEYWPVLGTSGEVFESATVEGNALVLKYRDVTMMDSPGPFPKQKGIPIVLQDGNRATWVPRRRGGEIDTEFNGVYMRLVSNSLSPHQLMDVATTLDPLDG